MTKKIISVNENDPVLNATQKMKDADVGSVIVNKNNRLVGIVTDRDIVLRSSAMGVSPDTMTCAEVMSTSVVTAEPNMDIDEVANLMSSNQIRRLPVAESGRVVGMISLADITQSRGNSDEAHNVLRNVTKKSYS